MKSGAVLVALCSLLAGLDPVPGRADAVTVDRSHATVAAAITASDPGNNQLLYFTSSSLTDDDRHVVFISDRSGDPNLFTRDLLTGSERQLTHNSEGMLKSYVYFDGHPYRGFGKGSVSLDQRNGIAYYLQGLEVRSVTLGGVERVLATLPRGQMTAFTHVSTDGTRLCVPTTDARALDGDKELPGKPAYDIDNRVVTEGLSSYLRVYDTHSGALLACEQVPKGWVTHVQFSPTDSSLILYNNEWCEDSGDRRMWLWDGHRHLRLRPEGDGRSRWDWTCHEMWQRDGKAIIYHGTYAKGPSYIGRVRPDGTGRVEIPLPAAWKRYGHFTVGATGELVTDGYYEEGGDPERFGGAWISRLLVDWDHGLIRWFPLVRHGSSWTSQDSHPHPIYNHAATAIWFTGDGTGTRALHRVTLADSGAW